MIPERLFGREFRRFDASGGYSILQIALFAFALLRLILITTVEIHDQVAMQRLATRERGVVGFWVGSKRRS